MKFVNPVAFVTRIGTNEFVVVPLPSSPNWLFPHEWIEPDVSVANVLLELHEIDAMFFPARLPKKAGEGEIGKYEFDKVPLPSWPLVLQPHTCIAPVVSSAMV